MISPLLTERVGARLSGGIVAANRQCPAPSFRLPPLSLRSVDAEEHRPLARLRSREPRAQPGVCVAEQTREARVHPTGSSSLGRHKRLCGVVEVGGSHLNSRVARDKSFY